MGLTPSKSPEVTKIVFVREGEGIDMGPGQNRARRLPNPLKKVNEAEGQGGKQKEK